MNFVVTVDENQAIADLKHDIHQMTHMGFCSNSRSPTCQARDFLPQSVLLQVCLTKLHVDEIEGRIRP